MRERERERERDAVHELFSHNVSVARNPLSSHQSCLPVCVPSVTSHNVSVSHNPLSSHQSCLLVCVPSVTSHCRFAKDPSPRSGTIMRHLAKRCKESNWRSLGSTLSTWVRSFLLPTLFLFFFCCERRVALFCTLGVCWLGGATCCEHRLSCGHHAL